MNLEYIWIGGNNELRSKQKIMILKPDFELKDIPEWNFDGSSTKQSFGLDTEVILKPVSFVKSPFKLSNAPSFLVLCETYTNGPHPTNHRSNAAKVFESGTEACPWFGLEQEYFMLSETMMNDTLEQGPYYCGVGKGKHPIERQIALEHLDACLYAELNISGVNAEVAHCQWEYQIGPCVGIDAADQLILSRYILERIAESHNVRIYYDPKLFQTLNGSGCHVNFSTKDMREPGGIESIHRFIDTLSLYHQGMLDISGEGNEQRLTGKHETSSLDEFTWGVGTRHTSVRIPNSVQKDGCGYLEDRRYAANIDPYLVTGRLFSLYKKSVQGLHPSN